MKRLQHWFDVLAGISQQELARLDLAERIYTVPPADLSGLQLPACWRRQRRVRMAGRRV